MRRDADAAGLGECLGVLVGEERAPHLQCAAASEWTVTVETGRHLLEHGVEEHRFEFPGDAFRLALDGERGLSLRGAGIAELRKRSAELGGCCIRHHITSMSAWMAPAALIACRITMRSRGP